MPAYLGNTLINFDRFKDTEAIKAKAIASAAEGGPNSGFEIEGMDLFKDPALAGDFPDLKEDIDLVISTEAHVSDLVEMYHRIRSAKGMSRGMAVDLIHLVPSLESHITPRHYTENLSGVGLEPSLEALSAKVWGMIVAAVVVVISLIYKVIKWLLGGKEPSDANEHNLAQRVQTATENVEVQNRLTKSSLSQLQSIKGDTEEVEVPLYQDKKVIERSHIPPALKEELLEKTKNIVTGKEDAAETVVIYVDVHDIFADVNVNAETKKYFTEPPPLARAIYHPNGNLVEFIMSSSAAFKMGVAQCDKMIESLDVLTRILKEGDRNKKLDPNDYAEEMAKLTKLTEKDPSVKVGSLTIPGFKMWEKHLTSQADGSLVKDVTFDNLEDFMRAHERVSGIIKRFDRSGMIDFVKKSHEANKKLTLLKSRLDAEVNRTGGDPILDERAEWKSKFMPIFNGLSTIIVSMGKAFEVVTRVINEVSTTGARAQHALAVNSSRLATFMRQYHPKRLSAILREEEIIKENAAEAEKHTEGLKFPSVALGGVKASVNGRIVDQSIAQKLIDNAKGDFKL